MKKQMMRFVSVFMLVLALLTMTSCGTQPEEETSTVTRLKLNEVGVMLEVNETFQIQPEGDVENITYTSGNEKVATVDANGLIKAVGKGNAVITAAAGDMTATCGVIVGLADSQLIDIREVEPERIVAEQYLLTATVLRDVLVVDGDIYYVQRSDSAPSDLKVQHIDKNGDPDEWMNLIGFGGGVSVGMEKADDGKLYIWVESNGTAASVGQTLSRIPYEPGTTYVAQGGQTWYFGQMEDAPYASVDTENRLVCVRTASGSAYRFTYYDYDSMIAGETPVPLYAQELSILTSGLSKDVNPTGASIGEHKFRGFAVSGRYIYQYYGTAKNALLVAAYDMSGECQYVHKVTEFKDLVFREPDGLHVADGKLYLGIATGESGDRRANVLMYG